MKMMTEINTAVERLTAAGIKCKKNVRFSHLTTFKLGGPCSLLVNVWDPDAVVEAVQILAASDIDYMLIGGGSNLLVSDQGLDLVVLRFVSDNPAIARDDTELTVSGGTSLDDLAAYCVEAGLEELAVCSGIPGTVGGAVAGNAGAFGWQIGDSVTRLRICDRQGNVTTLTPEEMEFRYRDSRLKHSGEILLDVTLTLTPADVATLREKREEVLELRRSKHPDLAVDCCAGSFFRNIEPTSKAERRQAAGYFLEQAGAKEMRVGGAGLFAKHANIIVKLDDACTSQDVYDLHKAMQAAVLQRFGLELTPEVRILGPFA